MSKAVIVGNGQVALNNYGQFVDSCDVVIRLGDFVIDGYERHVGTKTTVYAAPWWKLTKRPRSFFIDKSVWIAEYDCSKFCGWKHYSPVTLSQQKEYIKKYNLHDIEFFSCNDMEQLCIEMNHDFCDGLYRPSIGIRFLYKAAQKYGEIYAIGFDNMKTGWYWEPTHSHSNTSHPILLEQLWTAKHKNIIKL